MFLLFLTALFLHTRNKNKRTPPNKEKVRKEEEAVLCNKKQTNCNYEEDR